jgi:hypothetical protein
VGKCLWCLSVVTLKVMQLWGDLLEGDDISTCNWLWEVTVPANDHVLMDLDPG